MVSRGFTVSYQLRKVFFDTPRIKAAMHEAELKALRKGGGIVRKNAIRSLRKRKGVSAPGKPPSVHSQDKVANLRNILFGADERRSSVIIGPVGLNQVNDTIGGLRAQGIRRLTVPELHEFGGSVRIHEVQFKQGGKWWRRDRRFKGRHYYATRSRDAQYPPRPFMGPALAYAAPKLPPLFRGVLGRG